MVSILKKTDICALLTFFSVIILFTGCASVRKLDELSPGGLYNRGIVALEEHRFNEAHYAFSELAKKYPNWKKADSALYKKGYLEIHFGKYEDARISFEKLLDDYPTSEWRFDAALWSGILGELTAYLGIEMDGNADSGSSDSNAISAKDLKMRIEKLEVENKELRRQIQMLRKLLEK